MRRLRTSTWQETQNVACHGTRTVLVDFPSSNRAARRATRGSKTKQQHRNDNGFFDRHVVTSSRSSRNLKHLENLVDRPTRFPPPAGHGNDAVEPIVFLR